MTQTKPPTVSVSTTIEADPATVYAMVGDVTRMAEWSPENTGSEWLGGATGPAVGARFKGKNQHGSHGWSTVCEVIEADAGARFAFRTKAMGLSVAVWRYRFSGDDAGGCKVTEEWVDERGRVITVAGRFATGVADRAEHNRAGMEQTLAALKAAAEAH